jgi:AcrR family transcriptional regulator
MSTQNREAVPRKRTYELKKRAQRQDQTRQGIVDATVALHNEVGPALTTVAEIARRAGVSRLTVYKHFPDDGELFAACQRRFLYSHPLPDLAPALSLAEPGPRLRAVLKELYGSYRERAPMTSKVLRDRGALPALDSLLTRTMDAQQEELTAALVAGFSARGDRARRVRAVIALALDFWTWQRLAQGGLPDGESAGLMADLVIQAATAR